GYAERRSVSGLAGWLLTLQATNALIDGLAFARYARRSIGLATSALLLSIGYTTLLLDAPPAVTAVLVTVAGLPLSLYITAVFLTTDRVTPAGTSAEAFAWVSTSFAIGSATGAALNGAVLAHVRGARPGFALAPFVL